MILGREGRVDGCGFGSVLVEQGLGDDLVRGLLGGLMALSEFHLLMGVSALGAAALVWVVSGCEGHHGSCSGKVGFGCAYNRP